MIVAKRFLAVILSSAVLIYAQGNMFTKVRYNGGSVSSKVNAKDWGNKLTITPQAIVLDLKDGQRVEIPPESVTSLSYGQEAHRRVGTMIALAVLVAPVALFGLLHKTRLHFIGVQYKTPENNSGGILLQADKDNYRAMLVALQGVTAAPVVVAEKEREYIPVGLTTNVTKGTDESTGANQAPAAPAAPAAPTNATEPVSLAAIPPVVLKLPATYASTQAPADQIQLNGDNTFSLQEDGQTYRGTFAANGNAVELNASETSAKTTLTIQSNTLTDSSGQTWVLREQTAQPAPSEDTFKNQDVISLVKAGLDDATIIAKIASSKCQFDTSTAALIQLKQSGVSDAVIRAVVGAGR